MARIRSIKSDFFFHEELATLHPLTRLLFVGLWTIADKDGRLDDRPARIKAQTLPWDDCDADAMLDDLVGGEFIVRYAAAGKKYIAIPSFPNHQRPHPKEANSVIPAPSIIDMESSREKVRLSREKVRLSREKVRLSREKPGSFPSCPPGGFPSCPPGKEISVSGKEILEIDDGSSFKSSSPEDDDREELTQKPTQATISPIFSLEEQKAKKREPAQSSQQKFAAWFEEQRRKKLGPLFHPDDPWSIPRTNKQLKWIEQEPKQLVIAAVELFLSDEFQRNQPMPCPLKFFVSAKNEWLAKAKRAS